jgi:DNA helicase-2/ATP-dependent DNA helicase PcrA
MSEKRKVELNEEQRLVVESNAKRLLVIAGAGTGKTHVIVERILRLMEEGVPSHALLALTFTEKAASEMRDRIIMSATKLNIDVPVMTFNAFGEETLRQYSTEYGISSSFRVLTETSQLVFMNQHIEKFGFDYFSPISKPDKLLNDVAGFISKLKQLLITPEEFIKIAKKLPEQDEADRIEKKKYLELAHGYDVYQKLCREHNVIDYDDQIYLLVEILTNRPNIRKKLQATYKHILVDEFQDTNVMQSRLVDLLVDSNSLVVVGDDDQSIYRFRGATLANILSFKDRYNDAEEVTLIKNYRSSQHILDASYRLIVNNNPDRLEPKLGIDKKLVGAFSGNSPTIQVFDKTSSEYSWIAEDINNRLKAGQVPGSIAVLVRSNKTAQDILTYLMLDTLPARIFGETENIYHSRSVRMLIEALTCIADPINITALFHTLTSELFLCDTAKLSRLHAQSKREHTDMLKLLETQDQEFEKEKDAVKILLDIREKSPKDTVGETAYKLIDLSGYKDRLLEDKQQRDAFDATTLSAFFGILKEFESIATVPSVNRFIEALPTLIAAGQKITSDGDLEETSSEYVNIMTIHKAKGLEWDTVYIPNCSEGSFPSKNMSSGIPLPESVIDAESISADDHYAEERRLMYVAMTRAKKDLFISSSSFSDSGSRKRYISRFVAEIKSDKTSYQEVSFEARQVDLLRHIEYETNSKVPKSILDGSKIKLSVSQLSTFMRCPLEFYYKYVLGIPEEENHTLHYGNRVHKAIERINVGILKGDLPQLVDVIDEMLNDWPMSGYSSQGHRERSIKRAASTIERFYEKQIESKRKIALVESPFSIFLKNENITVFGRYDAVFLSEDESIVITDYKTTQNVDTEKKAKSKVGDSIQLTLYALAWYENNNELPRVELEFVDSGVSASIAKQLKSIETMKAKIVAVADAIRAGNYTAQESIDHSYCRHK